MSSMLPITRALTNTSARHALRLRPLTNGRRVFTLRYTLEPHAATANTIGGRATTAALPNIPLSVAGGIGGAEGGARLLPHILGPFLFGSIFWSTYYYFKHCNEELVAGTAAQDDVRNQIWGLFKVYQYLELTTDGPRFDLSELASLVNWQAAVEAAPTRSSAGLVYYVWSTLLNGVDNTIALFPAMDSKAKLIRMGLLDNLEEALDSPDSTVRLCAAYVVSRLVRNSQAARIVAERPAIVNSLLQLCEEEMMVSETDGRFVGFVHSESNTSAEVFVTLLETLNHILEATVNKNVFLIGGGSTATSSSGANTPMSVSGRSVLDQVEPQLIRKMANVLRQLDGFNAHVQSAHAVFSDHHMVLYRRFFPRQLDDQVRRRMREVEANIATFMAQVSKDEGSCERLMLDRFVLQGLAPLAVTEVRNGSAFVHAVGAVHNIFEAVIAHREAKAATLVEEDDELAEADIDNPSLYVENFRNKNALVQAAEMVVDLDPTPRNTFTGFLSSLVPNPMSPVSQQQHSSIYAMRCYTSSMACLLAGGIYGLVRAPAKMMVEPLMVYSVNGLGAVALNLIYGTYGLRNWIKRHTYIEDERAAVAWTFSQVALDASILRVLVQRHPFALLPMVAVNMLGHNTYPGTGLKRCDGIDCAFGLD